MILTMPNVKFLDQQQPNTKALQTKASNLSFQDLLKGNANWLQTDIPLSQSDDKDSQLDEMMDKFEKLLPSEVLDIVKDNETLQQELFAFAMQNEFPMQENEPKLGFSTEDILGHNQAVGQKEINPLEASALDSKLDLQSGKDIYMKMTELMQSIETEEDIENIANSLTKLLQEWNQFVQGQTPIDQQQVLSYINQQVISADASIADKLAYQQTNQLLELSQSPKAEGESVQPNQQKILDYIKQQLMTAGSLINGKSGYQQTDQFVKSNLLDEGLMENVQGERQQRNGLNDEAAEQDANRLRQVPKVDAEGQKHLESKVATWLQSAFQGASPGVFKQDSLPISRVEQYILHTGQADSAKMLSGKELIDKIETLVQSQRMQGFIQGQNPISIQLRPENLGDMTIRFVQVDGEVTVQMLVSSKFVKELLESNMHQLRNVFSPHQVTVEKQDNLLLSNTETSKSSKENQHEQQQSSQHEGSSDSHQGKQTSDSDSFEAFMEELLSQTIEEQV